LKGKARAPLAANASMTALVIVPALDGGASDAGAVELVRILAAA